MIGNSKFNMWTITYINKKGLHSNIECQDKAELSIELSYLRENGQDMEYVNVFPPKSNLTYDELLNY
jgi:hypothetical protein